MLTAGHSFHLAASRSRPPGLSCSLVLVGRLFAFHRLLSRSVYARPAARLHPLVRREGGVRN